MQAVPVLSQPFRDCIVNSVPEPSHIFSEYDGLFDAKVNQPVLVSSDTVPSQPPHFIISAQPGAISSV